MVCCKLSNYLCVIYLMSLKPTLDRGSEHTPLLQLSQYSVAACHPSCRRQSCLDPVNVNLLQRVINVQLLNVHYTKWYILLCVFLCGMPRDIKMANGKLLWFLNQLFFWNGENVQTYGNAGCSLKYVVLRTLRSLPCVWCSLQWCYRLQCVLYHLFFIEQ